MRLAKRSGRKTSRDFRILGICALALSLCGTAFAGLVPTIGRRAWKPEAFDTACTNQESWQAGRIVPKFYATQFEHAFDGKGKQGPFQLMLLADLLKNTTTAPATRYLAEYWTYRVFYGMKLYDLAHQGFASLVARDPVPGAEAARMAALSCLNRINGLYPSMILDSFPADKLASFPAGMVSHEAALDLAKAKLSEQSSAADFKSELAALDGASAQQGLLHLLQGADQGSEPEVLRGTIQLFKAYPYPKGFTTDPDAVYLFLGESFYGLHKYERAIRAFSRVRNTSNSFVEALLGLGWSQLMLNSYGDAIGTSENLIVGGLKGVFAPEANLIVSIALNETCNFPEAIDSIKFYKKSYARSNAWLQKWQNMGGHADLLKAVTGYLKKTFRVPSRVASQWLASAVFISGQDEINHLDDENAASANLARRITNALGRRHDLRWVPVQRDLLAMIEGARARYAQRKSVLEGQINADLNERTRTMLNQLNDVSANMQLVEAEIYNNMSERMITDYHHPNQNRAPAAQPVKSVKASGPVWDWGKFDASDDDDQEIWEDEVGFLRTDVKSRCTAR